MLNKISRISTGARFQSMNEPRKLKRGIVTPPMVLLVRSDLKPLLMGARVRSDSASFAPSVKHFLLFQSP
jgi:hypothetical protein